MMKNPITVALDAQGEIAPGTDGWWQVWNASTYNVRVGDMVMTKFGDEVVEFVIAERVDDGNGVAPKFRCDDGETFRLGVMQPIVLLRFGTHNTLA